MPLTPCPSRCTTAPLPWPTVAPPHHWRHWCLGSFRNHADRVSKPFFFPIYRPIGFWFSVWRSFARPFPVPVHAGGPKKVNQKYFSVDCTNTFRFSVYFRFTFGLLSIYFRFTFGLLSVYFRFTFGLLSVYFPFTFRLLSVHFRFTFGLLSAPSAAFRVEFIASNAEHHRPAPSPAATQRTGRFFAVSLSFFLFFMVFWPYL